MTAKKKTLFNNPEPWERDDTKLFMLFINRQRFFLLGWRCQLTHHRTLHDALQKDEVQVIGCGGAGAVAQCVQKTQHRCKAQDRRTYSSFFHNNVKNITGSTCQAHYYYWWIQWWNIWPHVMCWRDINTSLTICTITVDFIYEFTSITMLKHKTHMFLLAWWLVFTLQ